MESRTIEVAGSEAGQRLDRFLAEKLGVSRARVRHLLEVGRISGGSGVLALADKSHSTSVTERFVVSGALRAEDERPTPRPDLDLEVVCEGRGWLVVDKPAGCGVHPLRPDQDDTVLNAVVARHPEMVGVGEGGLRSGVVHRLDVDTTGLLAFATDEPAWKRLRGAFSEHRVEKRYVALVAGRFDRARRVDLRLEVAQHSPARVAVVESGGHACRQYVTPKRVTDAASLVEIKLDTGFLHQIRASLAHLGHPILGDVDYGGPDVLGGEAFSRPMLHAFRMRVDELDAQASPPADFEKALAALAE